MTYWRLHYHIVWTTRRRAPLLTGTAERAIYGTLLSKAQEVSSTVHAIGGLADHIHLAVSLPPTIAIADYVRQLKGASSHYVNKHVEDSGMFRWQRGYGVLSFGDRSLTRVVSYVKNQKKHHERGSTVAIYERIDTSE